jgi:hypothetical protein
MVCCLCVVLARRRKQQRQQQQEQQHDPVHQYAVEPEGGRRPRPRGRANLGSHSEGGGWQPASKQRRTQSRRPRSGGSGGQYTPEAGRVSPAGTPPGLRSTASRNNWFTTEGNVGGRHVVTPPSYR